MIILPYGEKALLVNFEQKIDPTINERVIGLHQMLQQAEGITYTIPAYCSLTVGFDPNVITKEELKAQILQITHDAKPETAQNTYVIPVCYDDEYAPDMEDVCELTGLSREDVIALHTGTDYRVYMLGFVAGFAYLGSLPEAIQCPRKPTPRKVVPQGAVGLAGFQTGIYPTDAPGGWQLIGQTPLKTFEPDAAFPVKLQPGDHVRFRAVNATEYDQIKDSVRFGTFEWEVTNG